MGGNIFTGSGNKRVNFIRLILFCLPHLLYKISRKKHSYRDRNYTNGCLGLGVEAGFSENKHERYS